MRKIIVFVLILALSCAVASSLVGCKSKPAEPYDPSKFTESIDLTGYTLVFEDEFVGELDRSIWGDTRQGTRRDGFWTKNLAFTDGDGHLVLRTEQRGSRYCSETKERTIVGYEDSVVKLKYDDCYPFGMIAGDFGDVGQLEGHTSDEVGYVILGKFDRLASSFATFKESLNIPTSGTEYAPTVGGREISVYTPFYETAAELYNYYSFTIETKNAKCRIENSAILGVTLPYTMLFGAGGQSLSLTLRGTLARLYGFSSEAAFIDCAEELAAKYAAYRAELENGGEEDGAMENGCFRTENGSFVFPVAIKNDSSVLLTYVIVDEEDTVSLWVSDVDAALRMVNADATHYTSAEVNNEVYCKNVLFVTGPEGVYSGALRTLDTYKHGFGYYEIRCKLPDVEGIWHAFWMMCGNVYSVGNGSADGVEIDVFEYLPARDSVNVALHWDGYDEAHQNAHKRYEGTNLADGEYHTFGMNWDEDGYAFYIDGKKVWTTTGDGVCHEEGYMKISTEYGEWGDWVGTLDLADLPVDWIIDYVRIYDKKA
ncbi:MAG: glycoside hydrolase family 16 protein [Clostridia bacterium]|nr:glycoside hydrolase family 16 protein [Clostridia bacterium]